jgi:hypothetical protein
MLYQDRRTRVFLVTLFLCAVVCAQAASLAFEHPHASGHCCQLCHLGPLPFLEPVPVTEIDPAMTVTWLGGDFDSGATIQILQAAASSRAPPDPFSV